LLYEKQIKVTVEDNTQQKKVSDTIVANLPYIILGFAAQIADIVS